jgi:hypothetical protein
MLAEYILANYHIMFVDSFIVLSFDIVYSILLELGQEELYTRQGLA